MKNIRKGSLKDRLMHHLSFNVSATVSQLQSRLAYEGRIYTLATIKTALNKLAGYGKAVNINGGESRKPANWRLTEQELIFADVSAIEAEFDAIEPTEQRIPWSEIKQIYQAEYEQSIRSMSLSELVAILANNHNAQRKEGAK